MQVTEVEFYEITDWLANLLYMKIKDQAYIY